MATRETQAADREPVETRPGDEIGRERELEAALLALGVRPATRTYEPRKPARQRPAWRAFLARRFGI